MSTLLSPASSSRIGKKDESVYLRGISAPGVMSSDAADNSNAAESKAAEMASKDAPQPAYNEWAAAMASYYKQAPPAAAYYGPAPSHPHPYMWGAQPMMPYGTPPPNPYYGSYHPGMAPPPPGGYGYVQPASGAMGAKTPGADNGDMGGDWSKTAMTGTTPLSLPPPTSTGRTGESGSEGSSGSDSADMLRRNKRSFDTITSDGMPRVQMGGNTGAAGNGGGVAFNQGAARNSGEQMWPGLTTNARRGSGGNLAAEMVPFQGAAVEQDEREVKRQRRKQSNRESARRSRLRKQAECEDLGSRVNTLTVENMGLRTELTRLQERCGQLAMENAALMDKCKGAGLQVDQIVATAGRGGQGDMDGVGYQPSGDGRSSEQQQDTSTGLLTEGVTQLTGITELSGGSL